MEDKNTADFVNLMIENMFVPTNCECDTRTTSTSSSLIDQIFTNNIDKISGAFVIEDIFISDHLVNGISLTERHNQPSKTIKTRKIDEEKEAAFRDALEHVDWSDLQTLNLSNPKWELLTNNIKTILDETCPLKEKKVSLNTGPSKTPWMTIELRESEKKLREYQKLSNKYPNRIETGNTMSNTDMFKNYRNTHSKLRRATKRSFFNKAFGEVKHDAKKTWNLINTFTKTKKTNSNITELKEEGKTITDSTEIANCFNRFYSNVGTLQAATIPEANLESINSWGTNYAAINSALGKTIRRLT